MSKSRKLLVGILSMLPVVFMVIYFVVFFSFFIDMMHSVRNGDQEFMPDLIFRNIGWIIAYGMLMFFTAIGLLIYFIVHAVNNKFIDGTERIVWILIFVFAGMIGFPIYWYMRIWRETPAV